ncbi:MAG: type IV pili methyl-accepting chemotaxis transducer N-terminal domain-containing protein [Pseudomonadota bacterium]
MLNRRAFLAASTVAGASALMRSALAVADTEAHIVGHRINLAGRESTLIEQIAKAASFAHLDVEHDYHLHEMIEDRAKFERVMRGLIHGDPELGLERETNTKVLERLRDVMAVWLPFDDAIREPIETGIVDTEHAHMIVDRDIPVLKAMNKAVDEMQRAYGGKALPLHFALELKLASRQRTLTQRVGKECCMIQMHYHETEARAEFAETVQLFENSHRALSLGMPEFGIHPPESAELKEQYAMIGQHWQEMKAIVAPVMEGATVDKPTLARIAHLEDDLLAECDDAVVMLEDVILAS